MLGGGGGGAGIVGGKGGDGHSYNSGSKSAGGAGGNTAGADGARGEDGRSGELFAAGGGGGGGAAGHRAGSLPIVAVKGGNGGDGGAGGAETRVINGVTYVSYGGGGGGGAGAPGAILYGNGQNLGTLQFSVVGGKGGSGGTGATGVDGGSGGAGIAGSGFIITNGSVIQGGNGGNGSTGVGPGTSGGYGAGAGSGILGDDLVINNLGTIQGGVGGNRGRNFAGGSEGRAGSGGVGIQGARLTITTSGPIAGGRGGDGGAYADAIRFTAGSNQLELRQGWSLLGNVVGATGAAADNTLTLGGDASDLGSGPGATVFDTGRIGDASQFRYFSNFEKTGQGVWSLTGATTAVTPWTIRRGTLSIADAGALGDLSGRLTLAGGTLAATQSMRVGQNVTLGAASALKVASDKTLVMAGAWNGAGTLTKTGAGTLVMTGTVAHIGNTIVDGGVLRMNGGGATLVGRVMVNAGEFEATTLSTLRVNGGVALADGTRLSLAAGSAGPALETSELAVGRNVSLNISGIADPNGANQTLIRTTSGISADFSSVKVGGFQGAVDYLTVHARKSGTDYVASYDLSWTAGNNLAHGTYTLADAGNVFTVAAPLADQAPNAATGWDGRTLSKAGAGTLVLSGQNRYTGGTDVLAGTLEATSDDSLGAAAGGVRLNGGVLRIGDAAYASTARAVSIGAQGGTLDLPYHFRLDSALQGSGVLTKTGAGTLKLGADSGAYSGSTTLAGGGLWLADSASLGGSVRALAGTTLSGGGRLGSTAIDAGATHAPGNAGVAGGAQTIAGDYLNRGTLRIEATPQASSRVDVAGGVDIAGSTLDLRLSPNDAQAWQPQSGPYTLIRKLSPGAVQGTFAEVRNPLLFLDALVSTQGGDGNDVTLTLRRNARSLAGLAATRNQAAVAAAIDALSQDQEVWRAFALSSDLDEVRQGFEQLSGDAYASVATVLSWPNLTAAAQSGLDALRGNLGARQIPGAPTAAAGVSDAPVLATALPRAGVTPVWAQLGGDWRQYAGDGNAPAIRQRSTSLAFGGDVGVGGGWRLGGAFGYTDSRLSGQDRSASSNIDSYTATVYGGKGYALGDGQLNVMAGAAYTWHDIETRRQVRYGSLDQNLDAGYHASTTQLFAETGYAMALSGTVTVEPYVGLAWSDTRMRGFNESGGAAALSGRAQKQHVASSLTGLRTQWQPGGTAIALRGMVGWRHAYGDVQPTATLAFDQGPAFSVAGAPIARDAARVELGADLVSIRAMTLGLRYAGEFGGGNRQHTGTLNAGWRF
ncbi:autotransporter domain-containing protein [Achromobacter xylosoxidans]|uniref:Autotransporter domain-containing protein n=1 Tax=Alcaligenes xylosoxydans xylosoxydans TaxID=85698 RepID=A0A424WGW6_ALCXX|nr:autotransporter domain-containing protein [Achromobacter xylosoxidans]